MKISAKTEYACIAMLELSAGYAGGAPVRIGRIAERHDIPSRFLVQILLQLKGAGYVASIRGAAGGYRLVRPPEDISLLEVMQVVEGSGESELTSSASPESRAAQVLMDVWREATELEQQLLSRVTFADLLERAKAKGENMYYI